MIRFFNGHELTFACGSGALAFDGRGWWFEWPYRWLGQIDPKALTVVAKTVTMEPVKGNYVWWHPWTCIRKLKDEFGRRGMVNAVGLTNPGIVKWITRDYPKAKKKGYKVAASVKPNNPSEARRMAELLRLCDLAYVEVNVSCPNVGHVPDDIPNILRELRACGHPIVIKLSADQVRREMIEAVDQYVDAYHAINTIPWEKLFHDEPSPIEKHSHKQKGGVSGDYIHLHALWCVRQLTRMTVKPVIGGGGIFQMEHVLNFEHNGAKAFSLGSIFPLSLPFHASQANALIREYERLQNKKS